MTWTKHRRYLTHLLKDFDACTVVSEQERRLLTRIVDGNSNIEVIPNCVSLADYQGIEGVPRPLTLIFTGALRYPPNYEAMVWFMGRVYPRLQAIYPDIQLTITGDHAGRRLPSTENVILTGVLDDVKSHIARSLVNLAPIFSGGGTRLKILEAMALRTPVVSTSKGAEGLDVRHGEHLLIANTPGEFAEAVIRIFEDPQLRCHLVDNAFQTVCEKYNWSNMMPRFIDLVEKISRV
jgi:glycosyltransferase involved in cell wall biosynthesis